MPTYNRAHLLERSVKSVLEQSYKDLELIIVDDGSTDNTEELVKKWQKEDSRIRCIKHKENKGLAAGRNTGARAARYDFIANQDSDDLWLPQKLEREVKILSAAGSKVGVAYSRVVKKMRGGEKIYIPSDGHHPKEGDIHRKLLEANFITMQTSLMKKECFERVGGFDETLRDIEDWDFWIRVSKYYKFIYIPEIGVEIEIFLDSLTSNQKKRLGGREDIFLKHYDEFKRYPVIFSKHAYSVGHTYALMGDRDKAGKYLGESFRAGPFSIKTALAFFLVLFLPIRLYKKIVKSIRILHLR